MLFSMNTSMTLLCFVLLLLSAPLNLTAAESASPNANAPAIQGLWVWRSEGYRTAEQRGELLDFCEQYGFNRLLVQVHLDRQGDQLAMRYPQAYRSLIVEAAARGIAVEALDGAKDMAMRENWPQTLQILDLILAFNDSLPDDAKLAGVHYDIEPYIMDEWKQSDEQRQQIMHDLLAFYVQARERIDAKGDGMTLACDIPFWYDNKTTPGDNCTIEFNGETKNLHEHIQDICDYIGIMSYRRHATGRNSVTAVVEKELAYADQIGKFVTPALETIQLRDVPQITFYGQSPEQFWQTKQQVESTLEDHPGFGGVLIHCYYGARDLLESNAPSAQTDEHS